MPGVSASSLTLIVEHQLLSVFRSITEHTIDSLSDFMGDDIVSYEFSGPAPVAAQVAIEAAPDR